MPTALLNCLKMRIRSKKGVLAIVVVLVFFPTAARKLFQYLPSNDATVPMLKERSLQQTQRSTDSDETMVTHVRFLKVHKCASSTMQNLLFRFALRHNLTVVLPREGVYIHGAKAMLMPIKQTGHYDIFACHTKYSKSWFDALPIPPDAVNIAIVREPRERMISAAYKYRDGGIAYLRKVPRNNFIHNLLTYPERYENGNLTYTKNSMGRDFGFSPNIQPNEKRKILQYIQFLRKDFQLVLVADRFHESLVLMKRRLNWSLQDIIYRVAHSFEHEHVSLSYGDLLRMKILNFLDYAIYEYFAKDLDRKIKTQTNGFHEEVEHLDSTIRLVTAFCDSNTTDTLDIKESKWNQKFILKKTECDLMQIKERTFIDRMRQRYYKTV